MSEAGSGTLDVLIPKDRQIMVLYYFDEYNTGERFGLKKSILKFYKDDKTQRLMFDFISVHSIYTGIASFSTDNKALGYVRLLGKMRLKVDQSISNRPDTVMLQFFNVANDGFYEGMVLYSSEGDIQRQRSRPYIAVKKLLVEPSAINDQEPNTLARTYCRTTPYASMQDPKMHMISDRCLKFEVKNGILFLIGTT